MSLSTLTAIGVMRTPIAQALARPERARKVDARGQVDDVLKIARVYVLELGREPLPTWIDRLVHLRTLVWNAPVAELPAALLALPRLKNVHLDDSAIETLDGIEKLPRLESVTVARTKVQTSGQLAEIAAKLGGRADSWSMNIPRPAKVPATGLAAAFQADDIPDGADLSGVDLAGATFEDLYVTQDLSRANLAGTTWRRCDFEYAVLGAADLTGATFEDCYFSTRYPGFGKAKLEGARFVRCGGSLDLEEADLRKASFHELESDVGFSLDRAKAEGMTLHATFCSEKHHRITAKDADLRGATITFDITPERRAQITQQKGGRLAWKKDQLKGAQTDASTKITHAPLPSPAKEVAGGIDKKGAAATALGQIHAPNASLWVLAIDAEDAAAWKGDTGKANDDFQRALAVGDGSIDVGVTRAAIAQVTDRGWSHVWQVDGGVALVDAAVNHSKPKERDRALALRVAQWAPSATESIGSVVVKSGVLALLLPFREGTFSAADLAKAKDGAVVEDPEHDRILVPLPNGTYDVLVHTFGPTPRYEDEVGTYATVTRIVRKG